MTYEIVIGTRTRAEEPLKLQEMKKCSFMVQVASH